MAYQIQDDFQLPETEARTRAKGEFRQAVGSLAVGQGFNYEHTGKADGQSARVAPKKFGETTPGMQKSFKVVLVEENVGTDEAGNTLNRFAVRREADKPVRVRAPKGTAERAQQDAEDAAADASGDE